MAISKVCHGKVAPLIILYEVNRTEGIRAMGLLEGYRVVVADDDPSMCKLMGETLENAGAETVHTFEDGQQAWDCVQNEEIDLVITDWKMPNLNGIQLFNKIRQNPKTKNIPIIVSTGFVKDKNLSLIGEFMHSYSLEKPFSMAKLVETAKKAVKETKLIGEYLEKVKKAVKLIVKKDSQTSLANLKSFFEKETNPKLIIATAKFLRERGLVNQAEEILQILFNKKEIAPSLLGFNEMAKILMAKGEFDRCSTLLKMISKHNLQNVERVCMMGQIALEDNNVEEADELFGKALEIDDESVTAQSGKDVIESLDDGLLQPGKNISSLLNTIGVQKIHEGKLDESLEFYQKALKVVPSNELKAKVAFNIGYAYKRHKQDEASDKWFGKALVLDPSFSKARDHLSVTQSDQPVSQAALAMESFDEGIDEALTPDAELVPEQMSQLEIFDDSIGEDDVVAFENSSESKDLLEGNVQFEKSNDLSYSLERDDHSTDIIDADELSYQRAEVAAKQELLTDQPEVLEAPKKPSASNTLSYKTNLNDAVDEETLAAERERFDKFKESSKELKKFLDLAARVGLYYNSRFDTLSDMLSQYGETFFIKALNKCIKENIFSINQLKMELQQQKEAA